jgi:nitronate monooxygenase
MGHLSEAEEQTFDNLKRRLRLPVIGAPQFIISYPSLVIAQCKAGIVGSFPALNARAEGQLDEWLSEIKETLAAHDRVHPERPSAPFAVNQIVHRSNNRLERDVEICVRHKVPLVISSLGARPDVYTAFRTYGALVLHDIINPTFARKALEKGASGLIAVCAGAGGHAGTMSPFALVQEIRTFFDGPLALSGAIANGRAVLAARALGADFAYIGSMFIASEEANAAPEYKADIVASGAEDIIYTNLFTGVHGNYLKPSLTRAGLDPEQLPSSDPSKMNFSTDRPAKAWKDIWGSGQGIGAVKSVEPVAAMVDRLEREYREARGTVCE